MVCYEKVINTFIELSLYDLEGKVIYFDDLWIEIMGCEPALKYEREILDKRFIGENWDKIQKTYHWLLKEQDIELNPCVDIEDYQLIMWMFRLGIKEKLKESKFYKQNKNNNIYLNRYVINRMLNELGIEHEKGLSSEKFEIFER